MSDYDDMGTLSRAAAIADAYDAQPYIYVTGSRFRADMAHYMGLLEEGVCKGVILQKYDRPVAAILPLNPRKNSDD